MPGLPHANKLLKLKRFLKTFKASSNTKVEAIFTLIPNYFPPCLPCPFLPALVPTEGGAGRLNRDRDWLAGGEEGGEGRNFESYFRDPALEM